MKKLLRAVVGGVMSELAVKERAVPPVTLLAKNEKR
jgi:hypothetical protein